MWCWGLDNWKGSNFGFSILFVELPESQFFWLKFWKFVSFGWISRKWILLVDVPEGILVDFGNAPGDENAQRVFDEAAVNDVTEMRDLVEGYRGQNMFLNQEVLGEF